MKPLHIKGWSKDINLANYFSDNYDIPSSFGTDEDVFEETLEILPNVQIQIYHSDKEASLEEVEEGHLREILGDFVISGRLDGYSEYTITGFSIDKAWIGGHNLQNIIDKHYDKYLHILIKQVEKETP